MTLSPHLQESIPHWAVSFDDLAKLFTVAAPRIARFPYPTFPLIFSCSPNGVWPTTCLGFMPPDTRQYVGGQSNILDSIAQLMMSDPDSWRGGRFTITLDGAVRTRDDAVLARFELAA